MLNSKIVKSNLFLKLEEFVAIKDTAKTSYRTPKFKS